MLLSESIILHNAQNIINNHYVHETPALELPTMVASHANRLQRDTPAPPPKPPNAAAAAAAALTTAYYMPNMQPSCTALLHAVLLL
jgi:hypothetical protein